MFSQKCVKECRSPGHLGVLSQIEKEGLGVQKQSPTGQTEERQNYDASLQDDAYTEKVLTPKCLGARCKTAISYQLFYYTCEKGLGGINLKKSRENL